MEMGTLPRETLMRGRGVRGSAALGERTGGENCCRLVAILRLLLLKKLAFSSVFTKQFG